MTCEPKNKGPGRKPVTLRSGTKRTRRARRATSKNDNDLMCRESRSRFVAKNAMTEREYLLNEAMSKEAKHAEQSSEEAFDALRAAIEAVCALHTDVVP